MNTATSSRVLDRFLKPRSVAIIGLSRSAVGSPVSVLTTLKDIGYGGRIYVVNPGMTEAPGATVLGDVSQLPEPVDLAVVSVARAMVPGTLEGCAAAGVRAAVVITQGFADADAEGRELQRRLVEISKRTGLRIIGPNTIGVASSLARFSSSFIETSMDDLPVGQVAQSGFLMMGHHLVTNEKAGFCMAVDVGNACDVSLVDVLDYYGGEEAIEVIECHLEAIDDGPAFMEAARRIAREKPVVVLKSGRTEAGQAAVSSHTGAVAGQSRVYDAAFAQAGVIQAGSAEELRLFSKSLATYGDMRGSRVAVVSFSGGGAVLAVDALDRAGLALAELSNETIEAIRDLFPDWMGMSNPLDIWIPVARDLHHAFPRIMNAVLADDGVDAVICIYCSYNLPKYAEYDASFHIRDISAAHRAKPIACWSYGQDIEGFTRTIEEKRSAVVYPTLDGAARSLALVAETSSRRRAPHSEDRPTEFAVDRDGVNGILAAARANGQSYLFADAMMILESYGLPVPKWAMVRNEEELESRTSSLPSPLCLKIESPDVIHKSDSGGVVLGVDRKAGLADAWRRMRASVLENVPGARLAGVVVQEMAVPGTEVMVGMTRDAIFGPCLVFGAGGIHAEILDDFAFRIAPIGAAEARAMIEETAVAKILKGARGRPAADMDALVDVIQRVAALACAHPEIREIDLNPVFVRPDGVSVVDARMILPEPTGSGAASEGN
jgi:acyl-CoA synthetase (NDP forming)